MGKALLFVVFLALLAKAGLTALFSSDKGDVHGPAVLLEEPGVRALGLGGAYVAVADGADAVYWNPAGLQLMKRKEVQLMHAELFADQNQDAIAYVHPRWRQGERETWGGSVNYLAMDQFDVQRWGETAGSVQPREVATSVSYAGMWGPTTWGATGKWVYVESFERSGQTVALDVGLRSQPMDHGWSWGVTTTNLGPALSLGSDEVPLPTVLRAGLAWKETRWGPGHLLLTGQTDLPVDDQISGRLGCEYDVPASKEWRATVRMGGRTSGNGRFSLGAGVSCATLTMNMAFTPDRTLGNEVLVDVGVRFGNGLGPEIQRQVLVDKTQRLLVAGNLLEARGTWKELQVLSPRSYVTRKLGKEIDGRIARSLDTDVLLEKARETLAQGDLTAAESLFGKILLMEPDHAEGKWGLEETKRRREAQHKNRLKAEVEEIRRREKEALVREAERARGQGKWVHALEVWGRVFKLYGDPSPKPKGFLECQEKVYQDAERALSSGNLARALDLFQAVERSGPHRDAHRRAEEVERALDESRLQRARVAYKEGMAAYVGGDLEKAQILFEEALRLTPKDKAARQALQRVVQERASAQ